MPYPRKGMKKAGLREGHIYPINVDRDLGKLLKVIAWKRDYTVSALVQEILLEWLDKPQNRMILEGEEGYAILRDAAREVVAVTRRRGGSGDNGLSGT